LVRVDAPELARHGKFRVGVRTLRAVNPGQLDAVSTLAAGDGRKEVIYDRELDLECWYPATEDAAGSTTYEGVLMRDATPIQLSGIAVRDAEPLAANTEYTAGTSAGRYPLIIISHGYPGNRFLLSHLAENLATKGFVVVSIDHRDSTYDNAAAFGSTLLNRPLDQLFVLDHIATLSKQSAEQHFLGGGLVDPNRTGLVGYSMGGYGATITSGGGVTQAAVEQPQRPGLATHLSDSREHRERFDPRIKAVLSFAPWGMASGFWDGSGLAAVRIPTMLVAGSNDTTSGYDDSPGDEKGVAEMFAKMVGVERYLLSFANAVRRLLPSFVVSCHLPRGDATVKTILTCGAELISTMIIVSWMRRDTMLVHRCHHHKNLGRTQKRCRI
jgi:predicted dienelactone hydrolase